MFDRDPIMSWVKGRIALLGDAAHPPLQYMAQGAIMAIEDGWVLAEHVGRQAARRTGHSLGVDWDAPLAAYEAVRPEHCRRVVETARDWGDLWHLDGEKCEHQCDPAGAEHLRLLIRGLDLWPDRADARTGTGALPDHPAGFGGGLSDTHRWPRVRCR